jgi:hypothetical protein
MIAKIKTQTKSEGPGVGFAAAPPARRGVPTLPPPPLSPPPPVGRMAHPAEIAPSYVLLASEVRRARGTGARGLRRLVHLGSAGRPGARGRAPRRSRPRACSPSTANPARPARTAPSCRARRCTPTAACSWPRERRRQRRASCKSMRECGGRPGARVEAALGWARQQAGVLWGGVCSVTAELCAADSMGRGRAAVAGAAGQGEEGPPGSGRQAGRRPRGARALTRRASCVVQSRGRAPAPRRPVRPAPAPFGPLSHPQRTPPRLAATPPRPFASLNPLRHRGASGASRQGVRGGVCSASAQRQTPEGAAKATTQGATPPRPRARPSRPPGRRGGRVRRVLGARALPRPRPAAAGLARRAPGPPATPPRPPRPPMPPPGSPRRADRRHQRRAAPPPPGAPGRPRRGARAAPERETAARCAAPAPRREAPRRATRDVARQRAHARRGRGQRDLDQR